MKRIVPKGSTGHRWPIFIADSSVTDGSGLTGLDESSATGIDAYYVKDGVAPVAISLVPVASDGSYTSGGFEEIDSVNMPGWYWFHPPNACFAATEGCGISLQGATNMAPVNIEVQCGFAPAPELTGDYGKNPDLLEFLMMQAMELRNKLTASGSVKSVYNDAGSIIVTYALQDSGGVFEKSKISP